MAWPATSESDPLYLMAATSASTAASNWIGPSMGYSLHRLLAFEVASRIVSMSAPWFESPDAYESMATRGSTPNCFAVCADATAICANSSADGATLIAQSPKTLTPA